LATSLKKKTSVTAELFYRRKRTYGSIRERDFGLKKKSWRRTFLFAKEIISIRERTFGHPEKKKLATNFSIGERDFFYRRKNFWRLKKKSWRRTFLFAKEIPLGKKKSYVTYMLYLR